jgi:hypothetical protein
MLFFSGHTQPFRTYWANDMSHFIQSYNSRDSLTAITLPLPD